MINNYDRRRSEAADRKERLERCRRQTNFLSITMLIVEAFLERGDRFDAFHLSWKKHCSVFLAAARRHIPPQPFEDRNARVLRPGRANASTYCGVAALRLRSP